MNRLQLILHREKRMMKNGLILGWLCLLLAVVGVQAETKKAFNERMRWWRDAKFGMFIHWGPYAVLGGVYKGNNSAAAEWIMYEENIPVSEYEEYARQFNPQKFDARAWVQIAKAGGAKYIIITSKHHDGFSMWDSKVSSYDIVDFTPFKRDVLKELAEACKQAGIHLGFYHSIMDWHHPDATGERFLEYRDTYLKPQLQELLTGYGKLGVLWFDGEWISEWTEPQGAELYNFVRGLQPSIIINNRVGKGRNGMQGMSLDNTSAGDFGTPEQEILNQGGAGMDWEACMTTNDSWGYKKADQNWKSAETLIHNLVDIAAKGGNYLLNVGPDAEGIIPEASQERFREIGKWLKVNGTAIYETRTLPEFREGDNIRYTRSKDGKTIYAAVLDWPGKSLKIRYVEPKPGSKIYMLGYKKALLWKKNSRGEVVITLPSLLQRAGNRPCHHAWVFKIRGRQLPVAQAPVIASSKKSGITRGLFVESESVTLSSPAEKKELHYTLDGRTPGKNSPLYTSPIPLKESAEVQAVAIENGKVVSPVVAAQFTRISRVKHLMLEKSPSVKYPGWGELGLIDGQQGSLDFHDGAWVGFEGEHLDASIDLGEQKSISSVRLSCLQDQNSWIFLPASIRLLTSTDGEHFVTTAEWKAETRPSGTVESEEIALIFNPKICRYLRIQANNIGTCPEWHKGAGGKAWLFADEIIIK
jgi:alpha-L-fucosidase